MLQLKLKTSLLTGMVAAALALSPLAGQAQEMMGGDAMGGMNTTGSMAMMPMSGTLVRRYTDMEGNVTAVDVQTAMGVRMVRLSPAIPAGDERLRGTYRMGASMSLEGMMVGGKNVPTFDPNAPLQSGLLMNAHSLSAAQSAMGAMGGDMAGGMMSGGMAGGGMAGGGMTGSGMAGGMMSGGLGSIRALVRLPNGRVTIVKEVNGRLILVNDGTHKMTDVGAAGGAVTLPASVDKAARVTMVNPDGTMTEMTADGMAAGMMGSTMMVMPDGKMMAVKMQGGKAMVAMADGTMLELMMQNGKYVVPESMTGAKMMMVMPDGRQMDMDTVDGKMMVMMPDGTMMPVNADGTMSLPK